ncbi:unnamed protein product [Malus baccata var. baccata]
MSVILCNKNILKPSFVVGHGRKSLGCMCRQSWFMLALQCLELQEFFLQIYPRGLLLNPIGLVKEIKNAHEWKLKRLRTRDPNMTRADFASRWYDAPNTSKRE